MHDLRLKVLRESGKTVSRKARSRPESTRGSTRNSPAGSPAVSVQNSPAPSRAGSRYASEDEVSDDEFDDNMTMSTLSNGSDPAPDEGSETTWQSLLQDRIVELQDRKRSNVKGRETALASYLNIVKNHYAERQIGSASGDIASALMKSVRSGPSASERTLALRCLQATLLTSPSEALFEDTYHQLETTCQDDEEESVKIQAIQAMAITALFGGGTEAAADEYLDFLLGIIESDGEVVGAADNGEVVTAALQAWAFVASQIDDLSEHVFQAMEAFVEQLDSTDVEVQTGAGFNIAFIFEAAREHEEETDEPLNLQYDPKKLITRMTQASKTTARQTSRSDRRHLRKHFASIVTSLERGKGPGYSTASRPVSNPHTGGNKIEYDGESHEFGYREKLRVGDLVMVIDSWSLMARIEMVRNILGGGFLAHFKDNPVVSDLLNNPEVEDLAGNDYALTEHRRSRKSRK